jgi:hypothetical protein
MRKRQLTEVLDQLGAYRYLQDRAHDTWLPDSARQQVRQIIKQIYVQIYQQREYSWTYQQP